MNSEKIKKLLELSKSLAGGGVWPDMLDQSDAQDVLKNHPFFSDKRESSPSLYPTADVLTHINEIIVLIDLPGIYKEDVQLSIDGENLLIQGRARHPFPQGSSFLSERFQGEFQRAIRLPQKVEPDSSKIKASFFEGLLTVRIPSKSVELKSIRIE